MNTNTVTGSLPPDLVNLIPPTWQHYTAFIVVILMFAGRLLAAMHNGASLGASLLSTLTGSANLFGMLTQPPATPAPAPAPAPAAATPDPKPATPVTTAVSVLLCLALSLGLLCASGCAVNHTIVYTYDSATGKVTGRARQTGYTLFDSQSSLAKAHLTLGPSGTSNNMHAAGIMLAGEGESSTSQVLNTLGGAFATAIRAYEGRDTTSTTLAAPTTATTVAAPMAATPVVTPVVVAPITTTTNAAAAK